MLTVKMRAIVWLHKTNAFKIFVKYRTLPIQPMNGMVIDTVLVDHLSVSKSNEITCHMESFDTFGNEEDFKTVCEDFLENGWERK